jgi:hypothetical protein
MTNHEQCLNEFRDASAAVRLAFAALSEAREVQIIANRAHADANEAYVSAQSRLDAADAALLAVRAEPRAAPDIDVTRQPVSFSGVTFVEATLNGAGE